MEIEIITHDGQLTYDLFGKGNLTNGFEKVVPGGAKIVFKGIARRRGIGSPEVITLVVSFGSGVLASMVANWLYEKIKGKAVKVRIKGKIVESIEINEDAIKRIVEKEIELES